MGSLDNNIRLIRNETVEGGNTKERIAETFDNIVAELESKVNKVPGKKLTTEDFTTELRQKLEGLQQVDTSGLLPKGTYTGNASSLKSDIDKKVDKVAGKGLSYNDYTNEEKRKNEENALKRVANITVTGDVNKIITITFADSTVMQAPFKDNDHISLADVHMNSLNFNENTGVLTGVKSDGNEISVSLDGRYSLIGHNHDERYAPKTHHHNEYALRTHRHNWDDFDGKPNNLATTENIKTAIEGIQIGGRNYIVGSNVVINSAYNQTMRMSNELIAILNSVRLVTVSVYIEYSKLIALGNRRLGYEFVITYTDNSKHYVHAWKPVSEADLGGSYAGRFSLTHALHNGKTIQSITSTGLHIQCTAENVKLGLPKVEIGNKPTDWYPAPEDLATPEDVMRKITSTGYEVSTDTVIPQAQQNDTVFVKAICTLGLQNIEHLGSVSFIKTFDTGAVSFTCAGKNIIYPFDNTFNGKKGSTAVVSIHNNDCYIRISNV